MKLEQSYRGTDGPNYRRTDEPTNRLTGAPYYRDHRPEVTTHIFLQIQKPFKPELEEHPEQFPPM